MNPTKPVTALAVGLIASTNALGEAIIEIDNPTFLPPCEICSAGPINIGFEINFFDTNFSRLYVNSKGHVTFGSETSTWNYEYYQYYPSVTAMAVIAPFWSDVDTRYPGNTAVYGNITYEEHNAFAVNWVNVDYYPSNSSHTAHNSFQLIIVDRSDVGVGDFDFIFNYDTIQWANMGWGDPFVGYGFKGELYGFVTDTSNTLFTLNSNQLPYSSWNLDVTGHYVFEVRGGKVVTILEPETWAMLLAGLGFVSTITRRRKADR